MHRLPAARHGGEAIGRGFRHRQAEPAPKPEKECRSAAVWRRGQVRTPVAPTDLDHRLCSGPEGV